MTLRRRVMLSGVVLAIAAGCQPSLPVGPKPPKASKAPVTPAEKNPSPTVSAPASSAPLTSFTGVVLEPDGSPAKGITVRGYIISSNGAGIISSNGAGYRLAQAGGTSAIPEVETDEQGRFKLAHPEGQPLNLEAVKSPEFKAIRFNVASTASDVKLQLAPTGTISGKVKASVAQVTNFEGVEVFIPGTTYVAKAAADGSFTIPNLPVGSFTLVATKTGLGRAEATGVQVESKLTTTAPELVLAVPAPKLTTLSPTNGGPGVEVTITGENFGASAGKIFSVTLGGAAVTNPERVNDTTLKLKVPTLAASGDVIVTVDGIPSAPVPFQVVKTLQVGTEVHNLLKGVSRKLTAIATDTAGKPVPSPHVTWKAKNLQVIDGALAADTAGPSELEVTSGDVVATDAVYVHDAPRVAVEVAGGERGYVDGFGRFARFYQPSALAIDKAGNAYIGDNGNYRLRKVGPDGHVTTLAGGPQFDNVDGSGPQARFWYFNDLVVDDAGNVYATTTAHTLRKIAPDGTTTTVAGLAGTTGKVDGTGSAARFKWLHGLTLGPDGHLYVADQENDRVCKVSTSGVVTTLKDAAGNDLVFTDAYDIAFATDGTMFVASDHQIEAVAANGDRTLLAGGLPTSIDGTGAEAGFVMPFRLAFAPDGTLVVAEGYSGGDSGTVFRLRHVTRAGVVTTAPQADSLYTTRYSKLVYGKVTTAGAGIAFDPQGRLHYVKFWYAPDGYSHQLFRVDTP